jgi:YD repeat-containing protein
MERMTQGFTRIVRRALAGFCVLALAGSVALAAVVSYQHDSQGRLSTATYDNGTIVTYSYDSNGNRTAASVAPDSSPPTAPAGLTATSISSARIDLSWSASTDNFAVAGYKVERCQGAGCSAFSQIATPAGTNYSDTGLAAGTTYVYRVRAYDNATLNSGYSNTASATTAVIPDTTPPSVPTGLTASAPNSTQVNLSWNAVTDTGGSGLAGYRIYRGGTQIGTTASTSYTDTTVVGSTAYSYTVAAYDNASPANVSAQSAAANVTTPDTLAPSVPTGLTASAPSSSQVNLSWSASTDSGGSGVAGYRIYRSGTQIGTSASTSYSDTTVVGSTFYSYTVAAYDNTSPSNISGQSSSASVTTPDTIAPSVPSGLSASAVSATQVNLSWSGSSDTGGSGLAGYRIYRGGTQIGTSASTSYSDTTVSGSTSYSYTVAAYDNASPANVSGQSGAANVTTPAAVTITISNTTFQTLVSAGATVTYQLTSAGDIFRSQMNSNSVIDQGDWLTPKTGMSGFDVLATGGSGCNTGTFGSWLNLGTTRTWTAFRAAGQHGGWTQCIFTIQIRNSSTGTVLGSATITMTAVTP